jgi:hypothetical protein
MSEPSSGTIWCLERGARRRPEQGVASAELRYIDVWDTQADWERFRDERASPAVQKVMSAHNISQPAGPLPLEIIEVIDAMVG